jgi:hypothetical protein
MKQAHTIECEVVCEVRRKVTITTPPLESEAIAKLYAQKVARESYPGNAQRILPGERLSIRKVRI